MNNFNLTIPDIIQCLARLNAKLVQLEELKNRAKGKMKVLSFSKYTELTEFLDKNPISMYITPTASLQGKSTVYCLIYV